MGSVGRWGQLYLEERQRLSHWRFWAVQALVVVLAGLHIAVEGLSWWPAHSALYFLPEASLLVPVGYAALNFGIRGSVLTALWCTLISLPNLFLLHVGSEFPGTLVQLGLLNAVAIFVGQRVENEVDERKHAEAANLMLQRSESRFRTLFESSTEAIVVCDAGGIVRQANQAAALLLAIAVESLVGVNLDEVVGRRILGATGPTGAEARGGDVSAGDLDAELVLTNAFGHTVYVEPVCTALPGEGSKAIRQVVLRDVSRQRKRGEEWHTYARYMMLGQDHDRRRMARELQHDMLHSLDAVRSELRGAEQIAKQVPALGRKLGAVLTNLEDLAAAMRHFTSELEPLALDGTGLIGTLHELLANLMVRNEIRGTLEVEGVPRRLPLGIEQGLYHIAEEALENVERHAGASVVHLRLAFESDVVRLEVHDNGRGFAAVPARRELVEHGSLGLIGMEERAAVLGGRLRIQSLPGRGTSVLVDSPT